MGNLLWRIECGQYGGVSPGLPALDGETSGAVGVTGLGRTAGFTTAGLFSTQRNFKQAMRHHRRPEDEQQQCDELA